MNAPTITTDPLNTSDSVADVRPSPVAPVIDFGPKQSFVSLVRIELRKMVNTRSGRWLLIGILALSATAMVWALTHLDPGPLAFSDMLEFALVPVDLILPVVGIMAMTSEWTQRTALTTFTLSPRRIPVLFAKLVAALVLAMSLVAVVVGLAFASTAVGGVIGDGATYDNALRQIAGSATADGLNVLMAAGFGLVASLTAVALLGYYLAPTAWALLGPELLHGNARWLDVFQAFDDLSRFDVSGHTGQIVTALGFWVVLPVTVGLYISNRREVK